MPSSTKTDLREVLGYVPPHEVTVPVEEGGMMDAETLARLTQLSHELKNRYAAMQAVFLKEHPELRYSEQTFVTTDAATALVAQWVCSERSLENMTLDIGTSFNISMSCLQHNFSEKQRELFERIGKHVH